MDGGSGRKWIRCGAVRVDYSPETERTEGGREGGRRRGTIPGTEEVERTTRSWRRGEGEEGEGEARGLWLTDGVTLAPVRSVPKDRSGRAAAVRDGLGPRPRLVPFFFLQNRHCSTFVCI